ncbi:transcriptional regulator with XRE-family HTH domain [Rhizobium rosettiformans]|uniref:Helix-turn-helix domain-containing protein n=2 Tax=Rhizobium rosettiformans TaxID=1368430 RepID=A0A4S8QBT9_9HYPH|nr:XRE family transcriptional regulator [Rhizobium rosettiformans]MBB5274482.1 transcriptional regulator with XRE-family HTH domain [Rhizobium rosettiformans]THV37904.1 helix-turn-helix domain-containing protein [Rhizobium rosettiformans W3]
MARALDDLLSELPIEKRKDLEARGQARLEDYQTLQELRKSRDLTQEKLAALLGINQENVSRLERRNDLLLSTLRDYVEAMGGNLEIIARFPDREPVQLSGLLRDSATERASKE